MVQNRRRGGTFRGWNFEDHRQEERSGEAAAGRVCQSRQGGVTAENPSPCGEHLRVRRLVSGNSRICALCYNYTNMCYLQPYTVAVMVPIRNALEKLATELGKTYSEYNDLCKDSDIIQVSVSSECIHRSFD